jgi:ribonuclease J
VGEVGKNATVLEYGNDLVLVDAGVKFPEEDQRGIDLVIPDVSYLRERPGRLRGILLTHGHEDHIGALPYLLPQLARPGEKVPLYGSALTLGFVAGVLALLTDCVRIERPGRTPTEQRVVAAIERWIAQAPARIILTTFASNIPRLEFAIRAAHRHGRRAAVIGRSMEQNVQMALELGYLSIPGDALVSGSDVNRLPPEQVLLLTTGSQGEPSSALARIAAGSHPAIRLHVGDTVILSATPIPGNDDTVARTLDNLFRNGAHVIYNAVDPDIHVSGHASRDELREVLDIVRPRFVAPIHGEYRHQALYAVMAGEAGYGPERVLLPDLGDVLEFRATSARRMGHVPAGAVLVDGLTVGNVSHDVLRDRRHLAGDGVIVATLVVDRETGDLLADPELVARGVAHFEDMRDGNVLAEATSRLRRAVRQRRQGQLEYGELMERTKETLSSYVWKRLHLRPLIVPVITAL